MPSSVPAPNREHSDARGAELTAERYQLLEEIGRGGVAVVHRVLDTATGREVALKRLRPPSSPTHAASALALFEREFHTLSQLTHPRIVKVHDYHVDAEGAFYTMEWLDGGDLHALSPVAYGLACTLMRDVCSALCLVHSRRFVHRDIGPRNIRRTTHGHAKLIDFGAMIPMGTSATSVGTPPHCPPEVLDMQPLDGRSDLYAVGTTLYFMLTGRHAYPARSFRELSGTWQTPPPSPSQIVETIPSTLDDLVMDLIQLDPRKRPVHAAEVMEHLSAIAAIPLDEQLVVSQAYLNTPTLVGRDRKLERVQRKLAALTDGSGGSLLIEADGGMGRTRFLDACALEGKLLGLTVLRASGNDAQRGDYGAACALGAQLLDAQPETARELAQPDDEVLAQLLEPLRRNAPPASSAAAARSVGRATLQHALRQWLLRVSDRHPLVLLVDDFDSLDEPSAALIALLAHDAAEHPLAIIASTRRDTTRVAEPLELLGLLSRRIGLGPLTPKQARALLSSMFGDVPHLQLVAERLHQLSGGNPRDLMQLAQHLVDRKVARYHGGSWTLPDHIDAADLPESLSRALRDRLTQLGPEALELAEAWALTPDATWTFEQLQQLALDDRRSAVSVAIDELLAADVARMQGHRYALAQAGWVGPLRARLGAGREAALHRRIAALFETLGDDFRVGRHLLAAGDHAEALDVLVAHARRTKEMTTEDNDAWRRFLKGLPTDCTETWQRALELCEWLDRPQADRHALRRRLTTVLSAFGLDSRDTVLAALRRCEHDVGLDIYRELEREGTPEEVRLEQMFARAQARHDALPERARVFAPMDALRPLVTTLLEALGVVSNAYDRQLWKSLPSLEPLKALAPSFAVLEQVRVAVGNRLAGRYQTARDGYAEALERLAQPDHAGLPDAYYHALVSGVLFARGLVEAAIGSDAVLAAADRLDDDAGQRLGAIRLRMLHCLWQGDGDGADRHRREFELARVQTSLALTYEGGLLFTELCALSCSDDLMRLRRIMPAVEAWARTTHSWRPMLHFARSQQRRIGGDFDKALESARAGLSITGPGEHQLWPMLAGTEITCLLELGETSEAVAAGRRHRAAAQAQGIDQPRFHIELPLSLALSRAAHYQEATWLAAEVLGHLEGLSEGGVSLGLARHNLARICLHSGDVDGFEAAAAECAEIFEHSSNQTLATKYRRLLREARKLQRQNQLDRELAPGFTEESSPMDSDITTAFASCESTQHRAQVAASLLGKYSEAERVFIYLPDPDGPRLAATVGYYEPPPQLAELVGDYLERELSRDEEITASSQGLDDDSSRAAGALWCGPDGEDYHAVVLSHRERGSLVITGVAVLALPRAASVAQLGRIAAQLSRLGLGSDPEAAHTVIRYADDTSNVRDAPDAEDAAGEH